LFITNELSSDAEKPKKKKKEKVQLKEPVKLNEDELQDVFSRLPEEMRMNLDDPVIDPFVETREKSKQVNNLIDW
jgi:hypothetical protein